ncbi:MAG TPA: terminase family protein [Gemmatimonadales bacterium]
MGNEALLERVRTAWHALPPDERRTVLEQAEPEDRETLGYEWPLHARENQLPPPGEWRIWLMLAGRGFGKTRVGAEWVREQARHFEFVNLIGATAADVRDVMIDGESGIMACCKRDERPVHYASKRLLVWPTGCKTLTFSAEDPESLRGPQHQRLWGDEPTAWAYPTETLDMATLGLRLPPDPRMLLTSTPKPIAMLRDLLEMEGVHVTKGTTYDNRANLSEAFFTELIHRYEGTRLGRQELEAEVLLDEGLAYKVVSGVHTISPFALPDHWRRIESMDYGTNNPFWLCFAMDEDGNAIVFGAEDEPGLVSEQAARIHERRVKWWPRGTRTQTYAPPDIKTRFGSRDAKGHEVTAETEFAAHGITFLPAQNDRRAGFVRVSEMLRLDPDRVFPAWHPMAGEPGAPRLFVFDTDELAPLIENLRDAPIEDEQSPAANFPGEAVDKAWEHSAGHAHAALRYGLMSWPGASRTPEKIPDDPRAALMQRIEKRLNEPYKGNYTR